MEDDQRHGRIFGVLFIITFITSIPAYLLFQDILDDPAAYITEDGKDNVMYLAVLLEFILILANVGTAVALYPIAKRQNQALAIGYVAARIIECVFLAAGMIFILGVVSLTGDLFEWWETGGTIAGLLVIPEFIWELSLGIYCAIWGFRKDSPIVRPTWRGNAAA